MTTNYNIGGTDIDQIFVSRAYLMDRYPELAFTFKAAGLWGWGFNGSGQLGDNTVTNKSSPVQTISGGLNWKQVSAGPTYVGSIKTSGQLWMWGLNSYGQLGDNTATSRSSPVQVVSGGTTWQQLTTGNLTAGGIKSDGTLWMWGRGLQGQLGDNSLITKSSPVQTIAAGTTWKQVSSGTTTTAAIKRDGTLWTWGEGAAGGLGDNTTVTKSSPIQTVAAGTNWKLVAVGYRAMVATKTDGTLWTWGFNSNGQLGDNTTISKSSPIQTVSGGSNWSQINMSALGASSIKTDGTLWLWGNNSVGQLGDNTIVTKSSPVQTVSGGTNWTKLTTIGPSVSSGLYNAACIKADGTLWTWGNNASGQLGDNTTVNRSSPIQTVVGGYNWMQVTNGANSLYGIADAALDYLYIPTLIPYGQTLGAVRNVAITNTTAFTANYFSGTVTYSVSPSLPTGLNLNTSTGVISGTPTVAQSQTNYIITGTGATSGVATSAMAITVTIAGGLWAWGQNDLGQIGDNTSANKSSPVVVNSGSGNVWVTVSGGGAHVGAIKADGSLWLWGHGTTGQLGNSAITNRSSPVQTVAGGNNWRSIAAGGGSSSGYTVATKTDGTLWTWGLNSSGQLGDNTTVGKSSPIQTIAAGSNWSSVVSAGQTTFTMAAIKTDGTLWTWGSSSVGALGDNSTISKSSPVQTVSGGSNWTAIVIDNSAIAVKSDGTLWTWGLNGTQFILADGTTVNKSSPVQTLAGGSNWSSSVSLGGGATAGYMAAIKTDGTLWLWGSNGSGQLGVSPAGSGTQKSSPVQTVAGGSNWSQVSAGPDSTPGVSAVKTDGTLWTWGYNYSGQLGNNTSGSTSHKSSPIQTVAGGTNWTVTSLIGGQTTYGIRLP